MYKICNYGELYRFYIQGVVPPRFTQCDFILYNTHTFKFFACSIQNTSRVTLYKKNNFFDIF